MTVHAHAAHEEGDICPVCKAPWINWPMAHKGDTVCGQKCQNERPDLAATEGLRVQA